MRSRRVQLTDEQRRNLMIRQSELTALANHPSWPVLVAETERYEEQIKRIVLAQTLGIGNVDPVDIAFYRGFIRGMQFVAKSPPAAERSLERFLRQQGIQAEEEVLSDTG